MKKRASYIACLILLSTIIYAADTTHVNSFNRIYCGLSFTTNASFRYLKENRFSADSMDNAILNDRNNIEKPAIGFESRILIGVNLTRFLAIETGVGYARRGYTTHHLKSAFSNRFTTDTSYHALPSSNSYGLISSTSGYHYLDVPLHLQFSFGKRKVKASFSVGADFNVLMGTWQIIETSVSALNVRRHESSSYIWKFNKFNFSPVISVGIDYQITPLICLRIMPTAQMQALKNIDTPITEYLWSAGLSTQLTFGFLKAEK